MKFSVRTLVVPFHFLLDMETDQGESDIWCGKTDRVTGVAKNSERVCRCVPAAFHGRRRQEVPGASVMCDRKCHAPVRRTPCLEGGDEDMRRSAILPWVWQ